MCLLTQPSECWLADFLAISILSLYEFGQSGSHHLSVLSFLCYSVHISIFGILPVFSIMYPYNLTL